MHNQHQAERDYATTQRIEAFSDGVFSIAITLLVLEIHLPTGMQSDPNASLLTALLHLWPAYLGYIASFIMIGIYWANHHYIFRLYKKTNHTFNLLNLLFLMSISFLPFPAAILSQYIELPGQQQTAVMFYAFGLLLPAITFLLMWIYASSGHRLTDPRLAPGFIRQLTLQYVVSVFIYLLALVLSRAHYRIGLGICLGLTLLYLLPSRPPVYLSEQQDLASA